MLLYVGLDLSPLLVGEMGIRKNLLFNVVHEPRTAEWKIDRKWTGWPATRAGGRNRATRGGAHPKRPRVLWVSVSGDQAAAILLLRLDTLIAPA
jgi:hypothetical protein